MSKVVTKGKEGSKNFYIMSGWIDREDKEKANIERIETILTKKGLTFFSAMRSEQNAKEVSSRQWSIETFADDCKRMRWADVGIHLYTGNYSDSGSCFEHGYMYAMGKPVILVHCYDSENEPSNLMLHEGCHTNISLDELEYYDFVKMPSKFYGGKMV